MANYSKDSWVALPFVPLTYLFSVWVLLKLWTWFAVPVGMPQLSMAQMAGVSLLVSCLTHQYKANDNEERNLWMPVIEGTIRGVIALSIGWVITLFM